MKKIAFILANILIITALSGCNTASSSDIDSGANNSASGDIANNSDIIAAANNLDLENTIIIENTPTTGTWQKMTFDFPRLCEASADRMIQLAEGYGVTIEKKDITLSHRFERDSDGNFLEVPLSQYQEYYEKANVKEYEDYPFEVVHYCSDDFYIEVQGPTGGLVELDNRGNANAVLGIDFDYNAPWRPYFDRTKTTNIALDDDSATCVLNGKTVKVMDAVKNAENYILENNTLFLKGFGAKADSITLISYGNTQNQSLVINFEYTINGVTLYGPDSYRIEDENGNPYKCYPMIIRCGMVTESTLDWLWLPAVDGATQFTIEECEINISREQACGLVSQKLSQEYNFDVKEIELMYAPQRSDESGVSYIEPKWCFYLTGIEAQEYGSLYVLVSAVDGEIQIAEAM